MMVIRLRTFSTQGDCEKFKEVVEKLAEINPVHVHYLKHNRKTVRLTKTHFDYILILNTFFLVQSALLGWFGGLASLKHYGNKALWQ